VIKHLVFDLYGTLADADKTELIIRRGELLRFGEDTWMVSDRPEEEFFGRFCENKPFDRAALLKSFRQMEKTTAFFEGIPELLLTLKEQGYTLNLLSNCGRSVNHFIEEEKDVFCLFNSLTFSYEVGATKPDPRAFNAVMEKLGAKPGECVMIGDNMRDDITGAERMGLHTLHFQGRIESPADLHRRIFQLRKA
jgi:putative hydrolase of the HAD superfamily